MQDVSSGTVKSRLHDARAKLKQEMLNVVENVLKSESPKEDFGRRIYEALTKPMAWQERIEVAREIGVKGLAAKRRRKSLSPYRHCRRPK